MQLTHFHFDVLGQFGNMRVGQAMLKDKLPRQGLRAVAHAHGNLPSLALADEHLHNQNRETVLLD